MVIHITLERKERETREKKREKGEKRREKDVQGQLLSICIQFAKRKNYVNWQKCSKSEKVARPVVDHYPLSELKILMGTYICYSVK